MKSWGTGIVNCIVLPNLKVVVTIFRKCVAQDRHCFGLIFLNDITGILTACWPKMLKFGQKTSFILIMDWNEHWQKFHNVFKQWYLKIFLLGRKKQKPRTLRSIFYFKNLSIYRYIFKMFNLITFSLFRRNILTYRYICVLKFSKFVYKTM